MGNGSIRNCRRDDGIDRAACACALHGLFPMVQMRLSQLSFFVVESPKLKKKKQLKVT